MSDADGKIRLYVSQRDAGAVRALGAEWDDGRGAYACPARDAARFSRWREPDAESAAHPAKRPGDEIARFVPYGERFYLHDVAYSERSYVRSLGAAYDRDECAFYAPGGADLQDFMEFLHPDHALYGPRRELFVPRAERAEARAAGCFWSDTQGSWVMPAGAPDASRYDKWAAPAKRQYVEVDPSRSEQAKEMGLDYDSQAKQWWQREGRQCDGLDKLASPLGRVYLNVPYEQRAEAKAAGARWDGEQRRWYVPEGSDMSKVEAWSKPAERVYLNVLGAAERDRAKAAGAKYDPAQRRWYADAGKMSPELEAFAAPVAKCYLTVPYEPRAEAKAAGAMWAASAKSWYVRSGADMSPFERWTARSEQNLEASRERLKPKEPSPVQPASPAGGEVVVPAPDPVPEELPERTAWAEREDARDEGQPKRDLKDPHVADRDGWGAPDEQGRALMGTGGDAQARPRRVSGAGAEKPEPKAKEGLPSPKGDARAFKSAAQAERLAKRKAEREERKAIQAEFGR